MISLREVSKNYGATVALHPTTLDFAEGKTTALLGASGSGKSTLLRLLVRLLTPTSGAVLFGGEPVTDANAQAVRRRVGYVIQDGGLFPHLTAAENVLLMAREVGVSAAEAQSRLSELCELTHFPTDALGRYPVELSGGQRQRVGLMRALMLRPAALLLDEPLGALDPLVRARLQEDLKALFARLEQTVILVTHDLSEAAYLADEIVLMEGGRVVQRGTLADLRERPASPYVSEFLRAQRTLEVAA